MKQIIILILMSSLFPLSAQQDRTISYGIQWGLHGNKSEYAGGMQEAHSRFQANPYGGIALDFITRYDHNSRWMATSGFGLNTYGFEFALTENYSLIDNERKYSTVRADYTMFSFPMMIYYKFNPNCLNKKWLVGAGIVPSLTGWKTDDHSFQQGTEGNSNLKYLSSVSESSGNSAVLLRFTVAREKTMKCGGLLQIAFICNYGVAEFAKATVVYTVEKQEYTHEFSNKGNFAGIRFAYFFHNGKLTPPPVK